MGKNYSPSEKHDHALHAYNIQVKAVKSVPPPNKSANYMYVSFVLWYVTQFSLQ